MPRKGGQGLGDRAIAGFSGTQKGIELLLNLIGELAID